MLSLSVLRSIFILVILSTVGIGITHSVFAQTACTLPPRLAVGQRGQVVGSSPNNLRAQPARTADLTGMIDAGGVFTVLAGAACDPVSGLNWWQVDYAGQVGWTAEGDNQIYFVEPVNPALLYRTDELVVGAGKEGRSDLALYNVLTGENRILTSDIPSTLSPGWSVRLWAFAWTPAGDKIAFTAEIYEPFVRTVDESVYLMNADGSGKCLLEENVVVIETGVFAVQPAVSTEFEGPPLNFPACQNPPAFSPVGWHFTIEPVSLAVALNDITGERIQLSDRSLGNALYGSQISPDGSTVALAFSDRNYNISLYLSPLANPKPEVVTFNGEPTTAISWSPDSQSLVVATKNDASGVVSLVHLDTITGKQTVVYSGENYGYELNSPVWSPSGEQIAFSIGTRVDAVKQVNEPHLFLMNVDGSNLRLLDTPVSHGPILWRP